MNYLAPKSAEFFERRVLELKGERVYCSILQMSKLSSTAGRMLSRRRCPVAFEKYSHDIF